VGRRRRRIVKIVKKKLPTVFSCPSCGEEAVKVAMGRGGRHAVVQCATCGIKQELETSPADQVVDVYCRFTDRFYGVREPASPKPEQAAAEAITETQTDVEVQEESGEKGHVVEEEKPPQPTSQPPETELETSEASGEQTDQTKTATDEDSQGEESPT